MVLIWGRSGLVQLCEYWACILRYSSFGILIISLNYKIMKKCNNRWNVKFILVKFESLKRFDDDIGHLKDAEMVFVFLVLYCVIDVVVSWNANLPCVIFLYSVEITAPLSQLGCGDHAVYRLFVPGLLGSAWKALTQGVPRLTVVRCDTGSKPRPAWILFWLRHTNRGIHDGAGLVHDCFDSV